jgi:hypothetical protein
MGDDMGKIIQLYYSTTQRGPGKVITNLVKGLENSNITYKLNTMPEPDTIKVCLSPHHILSTNIEDLYIGPNICVLPIDDGIVMSQKYKKYLVNSDWTFDAYKKWLPENKLDIWPVGIDTDSFKPNNEEEKVFDCLIYFKRRDREDLNFVINFLQEKNQKFTIVEYGTYDEDSFKKTINKSKYGIVIDNCESQGIAIQEMMSSDLPLLVWDVKFWNDRGEDLKVESSSVPYWDEICGSRFYSREELETYYNLFINKLPQFQPRKFILDNLSIDTCTKKLLEIIQYNI